MKKFIITLISLMIVFTIMNPASAATIESIVAGVGLDESRTVSVTVKYLSPEAAQESTLLVVKKGVSIVTAESSDLRYIAQKEVVGSTVTYAFKMAASDRVGSYDLYIGGTKVDAPKSTEISFDFTAATTINFVDKADTSVKIASSVLVNANIGDSIDLSIYAPDIIEYNGSLYRKDSSNPASCTVTAAENAVDVLYAVDDIETIETVSATVIGSNLPVLPKTLNATTKGGTSTTVTVTAWDLSNLSVGVNTVYGSVYGSYKKAEASVTVLPESFGLDDAVSKGSADNIFYFPHEFTDEFYVEFDMVINTVSDTWVTFSYNGLMWSSCAFGISPNGGSLKATGGDKSGKSDGGTVLKSSVKAGETYRILVKADASTDTFTVYATGSDGAVGKAENKTFRKEQSPDCINTINFRGNNAADGDLEIKNIKVHSKSYVKAEFVNSDGEVIKTAAGDVSGGGFTVEGKEIFVIHQDGTAGFYTIEQTTVKEHSTIPVSEVPNKYAVTGDSFVNNGKADDSEEKGSRLMAAAAAGTEGVEYAPSVNADGETISSGGALYGSARAAVLEFGINEAMRGKAVMMKVYVDGYKPNASGTDRCYMAAYTIENQADAESLSILYSDAALEPTSDPIFALEGLSAAKNEITPIDKYVAFDVSEAVQAALDKGLDRITFKIMTPHGGVYLADRDACTEGGAHEGMAAYLTVASGHTISVSGAEKLTKNGSNTAQTSAAVTDGSYLTLTADTKSGVLVFVDNNYKVYTPTGGKIRLEAAALGEVTTLDGYVIGVSAADGAQVRIGQGVTGVEGAYRIASSAEGELTAESASSGLRFICMVDSAVKGLAGSSEALINAGNTVEVGIEIYPSDNPDNKVKIKADKYQAGGSVFTAALVNLHESNYNRVFTAVPYVTVNGETYEGDGVSRSIYEVAAGILADSTVEGNDKVAVDVNDAVKRVLNAYVNQVGIRLSFAGNTFGARTEGSGKYQGGRGGGPKIFFTVTSAVNSDGTYTVTITPQGDAQIFDYWSEYIRLNNVSLSGYITNADTALDENGTLTLEIDPKK